MKIQNLIILFLFILVSSLAGRSMKTGDMVAASNVLRFIELYSNAKGVLPKSWTDIESHIGRARIIDRFNYRARYAFPSKEIKVNYRDEEWQIFVMAINGENEGRAIDGSEEAGRLLLFHRDPGIFFIIRIEETRLQRILAESGYRLSDYTGPNGLWANKNELLQEREHGGKGEPASKGSEKRRPNSHASDEDSHSPDKSANQRQGPSVIFFWIVTPLFVLILAFFSWMTYRATNRR